MYGPNCELCRVRRCGRSLWAIHGRRDTRPFLGLGLLWTSMSSQSSVHRGPGIALDIHVVAIPGPSWTRDGLRISLLSEARGARRTRVRLRARPSLRLDLLAPETARHVKGAETGALGTSSRPPQCIDISKSSMVCNDWLNNYLSANHLDRKISMH